VLIGVKAVHIHSCRRIRGKFFYMLLARLGSLIGVGLALATCLFAEEAAQEKTAVVAVEVVDQGSGTVAKAQINFSIGSQEILTEIADDDGKARAHLPPGDYDLVVSSQGFRNFTQHIHAQDGENQIHVVLRVGSCPPGPCLEVTGVPIGTTTTEGLDAVLVGPDEQRKAGGARQETKRVGGG
jgi:hypothetical protein